ncbi:MAG TPA: hypothetical protein VHM70_02500 [Polyangiaceae bacterium]|jgi:hypothetical protein|nr:hypothetical protein [Polyangiaceae bacterium]
METKTTVLGKAGVISSCMMVFFTACGTDENLFNSEEPARGPASMLPSGSERVTDGKFKGGNDTLPNVAAAADGSAWNPELPIICDDNCRKACDSYAFENPVNKGMCSDLWGAGGTGTPIVAEEACRRLWVDTVGRFPTSSELDGCTSKPWGDVVKERIDSPEFVRLNRRAWADRLKYDTESVSVERIYDMDQIVAAAYQGRIPYDEFGTLISAHPVLTRRNATAGDRAEALFWTLLGRPPFGEERADVGRLYTLWDNNYYDHPQLGMRLPDAYIRYNCVDQDGNVDKATSGECTSVTFGYEQLILKPDARSKPDDRDKNSRLMWAGLLTANEWEKLQAPGRLMSQQFPFWENAVNVVLEQYLGYRLATSVPRVGEELVHYAMKYDGDIRAVHYAVLTSFVYRQSAFTGQDAKLRYTYGPVKQIDAEGWVDSMDGMTGHKLSKCDLRLNRPGDFLQSDSPAAHALVEDSEWTVNKDGDVDDAYKDLVRNLGGCPDNSQGGRFKIVSVLTTANQLNYATRLCDPAFEGDTDKRASSDRLLPKGVSAKEVLSTDLISQIYTHQMKQFYGRAPTADELTSAQTNGAECAAGRCSAEDFARPVCFALLSSSEMLFY